MLAKRIVPCLDIKDGQTVKGTNFVNLRQAGDPVELGRAYSEQGADELVFLDITASHEGRKTFTELVKRIAANINIPFTVGGGINELSDVDRLLNAGADKISINSSAIRNPRLVDEIAKNFGSQVCVLAVDAKQTENGWKCYLNGGRIETDKDLFEWTKEAQERGAGEILFTSMNHDGVKAGYAKFETFPIWNLPLKHPVNLAYEAATADLNDINMIDPFHLEAYGETTVNYNRDVEIFPVLNAMFERILGKSPYKSPTDMGVNMVGYCICDDECAKQASVDEILRRYYKAKVDYVKGYTGEDTIHKIQIIMSQADIQLEQRRVVAPAIAKAQETGAPAVAIELPDGRIVTGKTTSLLGASSAALLNALKELAHINDDIPLISPNIIEPIQKLKVNALGNHNPRLHTDEVLIALAISATTNPVSHHAYQMLDQLANCEAHSTVILSSVDANTFRKLHVHLTCEDKYQTKKLYHN